jgi:biopolymer transport protein ExbD
MATRNQEDGDIIADINVTPLVDIVLVLLIIMMVTASYIVSQAIPMELPTATTAEQPQPRTLTVSLDDHGHLFLESQEVSWEELSARAHALAASDAEAHAVIAADRRASHGEFIRIVDVLRDAGIRRYAIDVSPEPEG